MAQDPLRIIEKYTGHRTPDTGHRTPNTEHLISGTKSLKGRASHIKLLRYEEFINVAFRFADSCIV